MSHVDEGTLHACLDGALDALSDAGELPGGATAADVMEHLRSCADCRARLEAERSIREGAGVVLRDARLSDVDVPPFAELPQVQRVRRARWIPLGWAASILLAVGAGWWGSEAWRTPAASLDGAAREAVSSAQPETSPQPEPSPQPEASSPPNAPMAAIDDGRDDRMDSARAAAADAGTEQTAEAVATGDTPDAVARRAVAAAAPGSAPAAAAETSTSSPAVRIPAPLRQAGVDSIAGRVQVTAATPAAPPPVTAMLQTQAGVTFSLQPGETSVFRDSVFTLQSTAAMKQMFAMMNARPAGFDTMLAREQSGRVSFSAATAADRRRIEDRIFTVEDASPPSIEVARAGEMTTVRLRQTLRSGEQVEIVTWQFEPATAMDVGMTREATVNSASPRNEARSGAAARAAPQQAAAATAAQSADVPTAQRSAAAERVELTTLPAVRRLADGRNEIVLFDSSSSVWIALRADLGAEALRDLALRLRRPAPRQ
ncbi:MAG TPA: zf-HC2 domain-containing protein [Longimicrobiales bacterium]|nr:zf-HC2 domain-containing protein [Longimicrobiales bacterium]